MQNYKQLRVWNEAHQLALNVHKLVAGFPKNEQFALVPQMRRAAYSIPSNIVEGTARNTQKDFRNFLYIALGSAKELGYFLLLSKDLGYILPKDYASLEDAHDKICGMLSSLISKINIEKGKQQTVNGTRQTVNTNGH